MASCASGQWRWVMWSRLQVTWKATSGVLPDDERPHWMLDPFKAVGPLRFGMSRDDASSVIDEINMRHADKSKHWRLGYKGYSRSGVKLYFTSDACLEGVSVEVIRGPQVFADGRPLVAQAPSVMERWVARRAESRGEDAEIAYLGTGDIVSRTLGVAFCIQRAGDQLITRPVFMSDPEMDDVHHQLPGEAWDFF